MTLIASGKEYEIARHIDYHTNQIEHVIFVGTSGDDTWIKVETGRHERDLSYCLCAKEASEKGPRLQLFY